MSAQGPRRWQARLWQARPWQTRPWRTEQSGLVIQMSLAGLVGTIALALILVGLLGRGTRDSRDRNGEHQLRIQLPVDAAELDPPELTRALDLASRAGATEVSAGAAWWYLTRGSSPDRYNWSALDRLVNAARARGLRVRLQLTGTPDAVHPELAATVPDLAQRVWYPPRTPRQLQQWGQFVHDTVAHFKGRVDSFELWNEPNIDMFWKPAPAPAEYVRLLAEGYRNAKRAWPRARVVFGGLSQNDLGYLQRFYTEARRFDPEADRHDYFFDVLNVHPYTDGRSPDQVLPAAVKQGRFGTVDKNFSGLQKMKDLMDRNEGARFSSGKSIVVGEYGFTTIATTMGIGRIPAVPDRRRAYYLKRAVAVADELGFVSGFSWYAFLPDSAVDPGWPIATLDRTDSWTFQALTDLTDLVVRGRSRVRHPKVTLPESSVLRPGLTPIRPVLTGLDASDVMYTELYINGALQAQANGAVVYWSPDMATGATSTAGGRVQIVVYTRDRHVWPSNITRLTSGTDPGGNGQ